MNPQKLTFFLGLCMLSVPLLLFVAFTRHRPDLILVRPLWVQHVLVGWLNFSGPLKPPNSLQLLLREAPQQRTLFVHHTEGLGGSTLPHTP